MEREYGEYYTLEQTEAMIEGIRSGRLDMPAKMADEIVERCEYINGVEKEQNPEEKVQMSEILKEVGVWPEMAKRWLEGVL